MTEKITTKVPDRIFVAMGSRKSNGIVHYYMTEDDFKNGRCMCGRHVNPDKRFVHWDTAYDLSREHTCKLCDITLRIALVLLESQRRNDDTLFRQTVESYKTNWFSAADIARKLDRNEELVEAQLRNYAGCLQTAVDNIIMYRCIQLEDVVQMVHNNTEGMPTAEECDA